MLKGAAVTSQCSADFRSDKIEDDHLLCSIVHVQSSSRQYVLSPLRELEQSVVGVEGREGKAAGNQEGLLGAVTFALGIEG